MEFMGLVFLLLGLGLMYFARRTQGISGAVLFLLGLAVLGFGAYALFFEPGTGPFEWLGLSRS